MLVVGRFSNMVRNRASVTQQATTKVTVSTNIQLTYYYKNYKSQLLLTNAEEAFLNFLYISELLNLSNMTNASASLLPVSP